MTISIHKLTAGSGYDYLTRQVAALDATEKGHTGLSSYYTEKGETPGQWVGSGMSGIDGLNGGDVVTADHMQNLFGAGYHPLATERTKALDLQLGRPPSQRDPQFQDRPPGPADYRAASQLGVPYKVYAGDVSPFRVEVARRLGEVNQAVGLPGDWPVPAAKRAEIRTQVAGDFFRAEHGRDAADARELAATIAKHSRPRTNAVAGFDLTFSPVKSVSVLWAVADSATAAVIGRAHQAAVADALEFLERHALFTRLGTNGIRQVDVNGLVAAAFTHRDSRAGDPDLHTHVAVANKVEVRGADGQTGDARSGSGQWRAIDGRVLFKATVAASETYNTALERHLVAALGVRFQTRDEETSPDTTSPRRRGGETRKRPVREIVGIDPALNAAFSKRRVSIEARRKTLVVEFQATHGRPPTPVETIQLAQQATLETRDAKHEPRSLAEQRQAWHSEAVAVLAASHQHDHGHAPEVGHAATHGTRQRGAGMDRDGETRLQQMVRRTLHPDAYAGPRARARQAEAAARWADPRWVATWVTQASERVTATVESNRATWQFWHIYAEAQRQVRAALGPVSVPPGQVDAVVAQLVDAALEHRSLSLAKATAAKPGHSGDPAEPVEPVELRRADGTSVYTVARAQLFTSTRIVDAERRLVAAAGRHDGFVVDGSCVDLALLEQTANHVTLNPGQTALVRGMATSGLRVQLAIAPAGSGKTTAMRALAAAWAEGGGTVVGLAPSAAAADALRTAIDPTTSPTTGTTASPPAGTTNSPISGGDTGGVVTDTLAKLTHSLRQAATGHPDVLPDWVAGIGPRSLVVIDEAGMADTLSLDTAVSFVLERGGSVRLVGDDQQLSAIGAGGVLRDIAATHGTLQLTELVRFADPTEGAASLALREGRTEALGFYLDHGRVHVGDLTTMTEDVFAAWQTDQAAGLDSVMLAPTRDLVTELNRQARTHRMATLAPGVATGHADGSTAPPGPPAGTGNDGAARVLADGNLASIGDRVITRTNDRRLRVSPTDWVKNGDRWTITGVHDNGDLTVQHAAKTGRDGYGGGHGMTVRLPGDYVAGSVELGYACTVHTAQGVTADTMHGLATGTESRQQLYTMLTRGRQTNHVYLQVVGDGDPHTVIHPTLVHPQTATDILEQVLARDDAPASATSLIAEHADPATRLGQAAHSYLDSLYVAAEHVVSADLGLDIADQLDHTVEALLPGLSEEPAWPALRAHLILLGASGQHPVDALREAASDRELATAEDRAAVLDWRLHPTGHRNTRADANAQPTATPEAGTVPGRVSGRVSGEVPGEVPGDVVGDVVAPLPWMPGIPGRLAADAHWGAYLTQRAQLVDQLAGRVHDRATAHATDGVFPAWAGNGLRPAAGVVADVEVWRAAMQVDPHDRRPTGPAQAQKASSTWQRRLRRQVGGDHQPAVTEWGRLLRVVAPQIGRDPHSDHFTPLMAERLAAMSRAGLPAHQLLRAAARPTHPAGPLPDEHVAAALWWRIARHVTPAVAAQLDQPATANPQRTSRPTSGAASDPTSAAVAERLVKVIGARRAGRVQASTSWPALVANVDHGLQRGWRLEDLLPAASATRNNGRGRADLSEVDECQALVWKTSLVLDPPPPGSYADEHAHSEGGYHESAEPVVDDGWDAPPADMWEGVEPPADTRFLTHVDNLNLHPVAELVHHAPDEAAQVDRDLLLAAMVRDTGPVVLEPTEADVRRMLQHARAWDDSPVPRDRMLAVNAMALGYYEQQLVATDRAGRPTWSRDYLAHRFGYDLAGDDHYRPGHAPSGWTHLVDHLRRVGVTDAELLATGLATQTHSGRLIDRFRDRVVLPVLHTPAKPARTSGRAAVEVLGFVGRRHPKLADHDVAAQAGGFAGPKYLNTSSTLLFAKGAQLYGVVDELVDQSAVPVLVEGPFDAIAVTLASAGRFLGVAPLGTALTEEQATQLARISVRTGQQPVIATDADLAGQRAAERDFWLLTPHGLDPGHARFPLGLDPADMLTKHGAAALTAAITAATDAAAATSANISTEPGAEGPVRVTVGDQLLTERLTHLAPAHARAEAARVLAAQLPAVWDPGIDQIAEQASVPPAVVRRQLRDAVRTWDEDPRKSAAAGLDIAGQIRDRRAQPIGRPDEERWAPLARALDHRLLQQADWPATATLIQHAHAQGHDVETTTRALVDQRPLNEQPARDLRYRLIAQLGIQLENPKEPGWTPAPLTNNGRSRQPSPAPGHDPDAPSGPPTR